MITIDDLDKSYTDWEKFVSSIKKQLSDEERAWLASWDLWDLAVSPMPDEKRREARREHFMEWFA